MRETADRHQLWLRMHPHLKGIDNESVASLYRLANEHFRIIPPDSDISTYAMIDAADKIVTFGSTVGIEATYWGKVSIMLGVCVYDSFGSVYRAKSHAQAIELIRSELSQMPREGALKYGYYLDSFGEPFRYYRAHNLFAGTFKGVKVAPSLSARVAQYARRIVGRRLGDAMMQSLIDRKCQPQHHSGPLR